jgi:hypothetical protein
VAPDRGRGVVRAVRAVSVPLQCCRAPFEASFDVADMDVRRQVALARRIR